MLLKYANVLSNNVAEMRVYSQIGNGGIDGQRFADELNYLCSIQEKVGVRINSPGGSVLEGYSMFAAIYQNRDKVNTYIDGIAASIAGVFSQAGGQRHIVDFGRLMVHDPHMGNGKPGAKEKAALDSIKESLLSIFENNTKIDAEALNKMLSKETWLNPQQAIELGFADQIFSTKRQPKIDNSIKDTRKLFQIYNSILNTNMDKITNLLGLQNEASEESIVKVIENLKKENAAATSIINEAESLKKENADLTKKLEDAEASVKAEKDAKATELVENAIKAGKIKEDAKAGLVDFAKINYEGAKNMINGLALPHANIINHIGSSEDASDERAKWSHRDWEKNDPTGLENLYKSNPDKAKELYNKTYSL